jgi:ribose-phosphate pyrophosphokinase
MSYELVTLEKTDLAQNIAKKLQKELHVATLQQFADGELNVHLNDYGRYADKTAVIIQSTGGRVNEYTLGVAFLAQAVKQAGAKKIIAVIPYIGYSRQDRGLAGKPGHMQVVAQLFEKAGIDELIVVDLHSKLVMQFFTIPVTNISVKGTIAAQIAERFPALDTICLVAPDKGAHAYVEDIANSIGVGRIICSKERFATDKTRVLDCVVDCDGVIGVIIDDIVSTGGTMANVTQLLFEKGYRDIFGYGVHPIFAGDAVDRLQAAGMKVLFVSNSLPFSLATKGIPFIEVFDISEDIVSVLKKKLHEK